MPDLWVWVFHFGVPCARTRARAQGTHLWTITSHDQGHPGEPASLDRHVDPLLGGKSGNDKGESPRLHVIRIWTGDDCLRARPGLVARIAADVAKGIVLNPDSAPRPEAPARARAPNRAGPPARASARANTLGTITASACSAMRRCHRASEAP